MSQFKVSVSGPGCGDISVPDTGFITNTSNTNGNNVAIIGIGLFVFLALIIGLVVVLKIRKNSSRRVFMYNNGLSLFQRKKHLLNLFVLAFVILGSTFLAFECIRSNDESTMAVEPTSSTNVLSISTGDVSLNLNVGENQESSYGYVASSVKVNESTRFGYKLSAYVTNNKLTSEQGGIIKSVESSEPTKLGVNTWGVATETPVDQNSAVWMGLSTSLDNALILKDTDYSTPANDETTIYYGANIESSLPCGDYTGVTINYVAVANVVEPEFTIKYRGENVYFDEAKTQTENEVGYANVCTKSKGYVGNEYAISKTNNMNETGDWDGNGAELALDTVNIPGADKLMIEMDYEFHDDVYMVLENGGPLSERPYTYKIIEGEGKKSVQYLIDGDTVVFFASRHGIVVDSPSGGGTSAYSSDDSMGGMQNALNDLDGDGDGDLLGEQSTNGVYNYGYSAKVYPVYNSSHVGATYKDLPQTCGWVNVRGEYKNPIDIDGKELIGWYSDYIEAINDYYYFNDAELLRKVKSGEINAEEYILTILNRNESVDLRGQTIIMNADWKSIFKINYDLNGGTVLICKSRNGGFEALNLSGNVGKRDVKEAPFCIEEDIEERTSLSSTIYIDYDNDAYLNEYDQYLMGEIENGERNLLGWSTDPNGTTPEYSIWDRFYVPGDGSKSITLYAVWGDGEPVKLEQSSTEEPN